MLLAEPPPSQADLHFRLFGIPVRIHPFFWVVSLLMGMGGFRSEKADLGDVLIWIVVVLISILVHELGHAFLQRFFGGHPWITLYSFGGLASCDDCDRSPRNQIIISLAGPLAGFILATFVVFFLMGLGKSVGFAWNEHRIGDHDVDLLIQPLGPFLAYFEPFTSRPWNHVVGDLLQVNILWGLVNLLPIYPLDGGQVARQLFELGSPRNGTTQSLQLSLGVAVLMVAYGLLRNSLFLAVMFGFLAYGSYQSLSWYRNHWR